MVSCLKFCRNLQYLHILIKKLTNFACYPKNWFLGGGTEGFSFWVDMKIVPGGPISFYFTYYRLRLKNYGLWLKLFLMNCTPSPSYAFGAPKEDVIRYLMFCPRFPAPRASMLASIMHHAGNTWSLLNSSGQVVDILLHCSTIWFQCCFFYWSKTLYHPFCTFFLLDSLSTSKCSSLVFTCLLYTICPFSYFESCLSLVNSPCFHNSMHFTGGSPFYALVPCLKNCFDFSYDYYRKSNCIQF